ncbi:MAG: hypothetical protein IJ747_05960 [Lachnospiraceae bacterium]|nr:hypothetical protein [Lachnospiraceae bacterium]
MKNYESPVVLQFEDLAEGVYAASGSVEKEDECWTVTVKKEQVIAHECIAKFRVIANHPGTVHISTKSTVTVVFSKNVESAYFDAGTTTVNGSTVIIERESHANAYGVADNYNSNLEIHLSSSEDAQEVDVVSSMITCTKAPNVQGGF